MFVTLTSLLAYLTVGISIGPLAILHWRLYYTITLNNFLLFFCWPVREHFGSANIQMNFCFCHQSHVFLCKREGRSMQLNLSRSLNRHWSTFHCVPLDWVTDYFCLESCWIHHLYEMSAHQRVVNNSEELIFFFLWAPAVRVEAC